ncbi:penicillin-insensitive murein endopeptidase [Streptomyces sp. NPDC001070]
MGVHTAGRSGSGPDRTSVTHNREFARTLGWGGHLQAVLHALSPGRTEWNDATLVAKTRAWQAGHGLPADGVLGPVTWAHLRVAAGIGPDAAIAVQLPAGGPGFYAIGRPEHRFGRAQTIRSLLDLAAAWQKDHPRGPRIGIGDISLRGGGPTPAHRSHRLGLDVDIRPLRADGQEIPVRRGQTGYSRPLTQELVDRLRAGRILVPRVVLFNDPEVRDVRPRPGHDNHLHVSYAPPPASGRPVRAG